MNRRLNQIVNWVELAREAQWSPKALADKCHVCLRTLQRHFEKTKGMSPLQWLRLERLRESRAKLQNGAFVKELSSDLDYSHSNNFTRDFKKAYGYPPSKICK